MNGMGRKTRRKDIVRRTAAAVLAGLLTAGGFTGCRKTESSAPVDLSGYLESVEGSYLAYRAAHPRDGSAAGRTIELLDNPETIYEGDGLSLVFTVEQAGLYRLSATVKGGGTVLSAYTGTLTLNGELPFEESGQLYFPKSWETDGVFDYGHQPELKESTGYDSLAYSDKSTVSEELYYYLPAGENTAVLTAENQTLPLESLRFEGYRPPEETKQGEPEKNGVPPIVIQAENPLRRSEPSILEQIDRTSAGTMPVCDNAATYNTLGGTSWQTLGESTTWEFMVEQTGWYCLNLRCRQDYAAGAVSCRRLLIDGKVWSEETEELTIPYASGWQKATVNGTDGDPAWMYLEAGRHTVTLSCSLGALEPAVTLVQSSMEECNWIYRRIVMITGTNPDSYRDYHLSEKLPDVFESMKKQAERLEQVSAYLTSLSQDGGSDAAVFKKLIRQFEAFIKDPDKIPNQINTLNSNISAIGTWLLERTAQPLELDWLEFQPYGQEGTPYKAGLWADLKHSVSRIARSYIESYDNLNTAAENGKSVDVWAVTGRDQAQIIQDMGNESFTAQTGIGVNMKLISADSIMAATVAGIGPDVTLFNTSATVIGYALRGAITDLSGLDGYEETAADFYESALTPYRFNGCVWALPETQSFPMLFYRKDILEELGLGVPESWDDVYDSITTLQKNNMTFGCGAYEVFLYQNGGAYYTEDGAASRLNSEESVTAFRQWTTFYKNFDLPLTFNFINRFRTGEMPLAIADYSSYNSLVVFAPEISGSWGMAMVPGTVKADGTLDRSVNSAGTAAMLFSNAKDPESAWAFLKWWASGGTQSDYARTLETKLGTSARVMVASKTAFENQMWTREEKAMLKAQWEWAVGTPEVAGGYLVGRHVNNAFRKIVYQDADVRETLGEYTRIIDKELTLKRQEYGLE